MSNNNLNIFSSIIKNLGNVLNQLPILPELFLLTATLFLLTYGMVRKKKLITILWLMSLHGLVF
jgi:hypothetical protein